MRALGPALVVVGGLASSLDVEAVRGSSPRSGFMNGQATKEVVTLVH